MTLRKAGVLVAGLPPESATMSKLAPQIPEDTGTDSGIPRQWSTDQHLMAHMIDAVSVLTWTLRQVNSQKPVPIPDAFPRPGQVKAAPKRLTPEQRQLLATKVRRAV